MMTYIAGITGLVLLAMISVGLIITVSIIGKRISMMPKVKELDPSHPEFPHQPSSTHPQNSSHSVK